MSPDLDEHIDNLIDRAKRRKMDAMRALADMKGDERRFPSRGPLNRYGGGCYRWMCWEAARKRHKHLGKLIRGYVALRRKIGKEGE